MAIQSIRLKKNKEFALLKGHPWVFREAVAQGACELRTGQEAVVISHKGEYLGRGYIDADSNILIRLVVGNEEDSISRRIERRLAQAVRLRESFFLDQKTTAWRLVNGEGDGIPGLVIDRYSDALSLQIYSLGLEPFLDLIVGTLLKLIPGLRWIWRRNQVRRAAASEGAGLLHGSDLPEEIRFQECGLQFQTDLKHGQKTGFFLDQRENRQLVRRFARGRRLANVCGYTGGFTVAAIAGGASRTLTIDTAQPALEEAQANLSLNRFSAKCHETRRMDMFDFLANPGEEFDLIVLDPPSMARSQADLPQALRAYQKLNLEAMKCLPPGGLLFTASCSSHVSRDAFLEALTQAALRARRQARILCETQNAPDHPVSLGHPEGRYLKGILMEMA